MTTRLLLLAGALLVAGFASGCGTVKPWQRDLLARPQMQIVPSPTLRAVDEHVYFSKEGSMGGHDVGGGGCGCN
jgi:hypothetical protein